MGTQLTPEALRRIEQLLSVTLGEAPYSKPGMRAFEFVIMNLALRRPVRVTLWPELDRVDVRVADLAFYLKAISGVEFYPGVEVLFKRENPPGFLFVSVEGRVAMSV